MEDFLAERGDGLSPEEREKLQVALTRFKEQFSSLTESTNSSLSELDAAINTTVQQNTQRVRRCRELSVKAKSTVDLGPCAFVSFFSAFRRKRLRNFRGLRGRSTPC